MNRSEQMEQIRFELEACRQILTTSSILAGFAFTAAVGLLQLTDDRDTILAVTLATFLASAAVLLAATCTTLFMLLETHHVEGLVQQNKADWTAHERARDRLGWILVPAFAGGLILFLIGIGLAGWIYSVLVGIVSVLCAVLVLGLVAAAFFISNASN